MATRCCCYGHLDKQPEMVGWEEEYGPWLPRIVGDKLYGRGGADDGYAMFGALTALAALHEQGVPHARAVVLIEACEELGSYDLPFYVDHLAERIGRPSLVVCLDSGCGNYEQLWLTTSLRGVVAGTLGVEILTEGPNVSRAAHRARLAAQSRASTGSPSWNSSPSRSLIRCATVVRNRVALRHLWFRLQLCVHAKQRVEHHPAMVDCHRRRGDDWVQHRQIRLRHKFQHPRIRRLSDGESRQRRCRARGKPCPHECSPFHEAPSCLLHRSMSSFTTSRKHYGDERSPPTQPPPVIARPPGECRGTAAANGFRLILPKSLHRFAPFPSFPLPRLRIHERKHGTFCRLCSRFVSVSSLDCHPQTRRSRALREGYMAKNSQGPRALRQCGDRHGRHTGDPGQYRSAQCDSKDGSLNLSGIL